MVADRQSREDPERLRIALEPLGFVAKSASNAGVELAFSQVAEGGVAKVVCQSSRFGDLHIELMRVSDGCVAREHPFRESPSELRDLDGVCEAIVEDVAVIGAHHLRDPSESSEERAVDDSVPVVLCRRTMIVGLRLLSPEAVVPHQGSRTR